MTSQDASEPSTESIAFARALAAAGWADVTELTCIQVVQLATASGLSLCQVECMALARGIVPSRYARNIGTFTAAGQRRLLQSKVLVAGLGGLGGYVIEELARAGVGALVAVDYDVFTEQNLNRQILSTMATLGHSKVEVARQRMSEINPSVTLLGYATRVEELPDEVFSDLDLALDCLDNPDSRLAMEAKCSAHAMPLVHGAIGGWCGQVGVSWPGSKLLQRIYRPRSKGIEQVYGTPTVSPAVVASLMVTEALRIVLSPLESGKTKLRWFDLATDEWQSIDFS